jgi:hypothetical protein
MQDVKEKLEKIRVDAEDCQLISKLATNPAHRWSAGLDHSNFCQEHGRNTELMGIDVEPVRLDRGFGTVSTQPITLRPKDRRARRPRRLQIRSS